MTCPVMLVGPWNLASSDYLVVVASTCACTVVTAILAQVEYLHVPSVKWEHHCVKYVWTEVVTQDINGI